MHQAQQEYLTRYLGPANPIITKKIDMEEQAKITIATHTPKRQIVAQSNTIHQQDEISEQNQQLDRFTLLNGYSNKSLVFQKYDNLDFRERNKKEYFASVFTNLQEWPEKKVYSIEVNGIRFSSDEESMNLFAVYQTGPNQFDLILQNDLNTSGYTQWFYFSIFNKNKAQTIKINIVNLYKSKSLYNCGMKPLAFSKKTNKGWQRVGTNVSYTENEINVEHSKKFYRSLTFQHTFTQQNNQTQFAHCFPYSYSHLKQKLKTLEKHPRIKIRSVGVTSLKKNIPILQFSQQDSNPNKKAIILMARQHPGQTVGSLIMDEILTELTKITTENEFLFWRFNIYCIPMVNIDGVALGNYRGNAFGYDLNRCWDKENPNKLPELFNIKKEIRKIQKKYPIELILDLHGHSRKMGSFFYGNPFGKNTGLYAYIASNMTPSISFEDSTFQKQRTEKVTTARIILGNMIKDTGCFYTYETSFYGPIINGKKAHFLPESFQQLARILVSSIYKTFVEINKQQKTLKESLFLKQMRKEINYLQLQKDKNQSSGSDSEAEQLTVKQMMIKTQQENKKPQKYLLDYSSMNTQNKNRSEECSKKQICIQVGQGLLSQGQINGDVPNGHMVESDVSMNSIKKQLIKNQRRLQKLGSVSEKYSLYVGFQKSEQLSQMSSKSMPNGKLNDSINRKNFLLQKLRVFGQTFVEVNPKQTSKQTQTNSFPLNLEGLGRNNGAPSYQESPTKSPHFRRRKNRNKSLIIRLDNKDKLAMADIVKVNRLEYKRIQRDSLIEAHRREVQKEHTKINMLPLIN